MPDIVGILLGALLSICGGWFAFYQQRRANTLAVAMALYSELEVANRMTIGHNVHETYLSVLDHCIDTGEIPDAEIWRSTLDRPPSEAFPVYHAMLPSLSLLPVSLAADLVEYHARAIGLFQVVVRSLLVGLSGDQAKAIAYSVKVMLIDVRERQIALVSALKAYEGLPVWKRLPKHATFQAPA